MCFLMQCFIKDYTMDCFILSASNATVAFFVSLDKNTTLTPLETLKYNEVKVDTVNGFNPLTGVYTVQIDGFYSFQLSRLVYSVLINFDAIANKSGVSLHLCSILQCMSFI